MSWSGAAASSAVEPAIRWLQGTSRGPVAAIVAVIAVATIGFMMLTGRIDVRRAVRVVLGCFHYLWRVGDRDRHRRRTTGISGWPRTGCCGAISIQCTGTVGSG
jgi:hypothetical protein